MSELTINADLIDRREELLDRYRELGKRVDVEKARTELQTFCKGFEEAHGVALVFADDALAKLAQEAVEQGRSLLQLCRQRFRDVQFGLKLIQKNTGRRSFEFGVAAVDDPDKYLSDMVVESYSGAAAKALEGDSGETPTP